MADKKFMDYAEVTPDTTDYVLVGNTTNGVRKAKLSNLWTPIASSPDANYLTNYGGVMIGPGFTRNVNDSFFRIYSGTDWDKGAYISLQGNEGTGQGKGNFIISANAGSSATNKLLVGTPTGDLTWGGTDVAGAAIISKALAKNGYIKYASGLIMAWYESGASLPVPINTVVFSNTDSSNRTFVIGF